MIAPARISSHIFGLNGIFVAGSQDWIKLIT